jgi:phosphatidylglycerophosphate synthase
MIDRHIYPAIAPYCEALARPLARRRVSADAVTVLAFVIGMSSLPLLSLGFYGSALIAILINRILDGVDGALARLTLTTDRGAFLDITLDFLVYAAVPLGFAISDPLHNAMPAAVLLFAFIGTGSSFLAYSLIAERRRLDTPHFRNKGIVYLTGLAEGFETVVFFIVACLWPQHFAFTAYIFAALCLITVITRLMAGWQAFAKRN